MAQETMPQTIPPPHRGGHVLHLQAQETLGTSDIRASVKRPNSVDEDTWIASQSKVIFEEAVRVVSFISDICTDHTCPIMSAGEKVHYHWADETTTVPELLPAPQYMRRLVEWADAKLLDKDLLPSDGSPMPPELRPALAQILRRLFRVYAHAYVHHFQLIHDSGAEAHLNCNFKHFLFFVLEFNLVSMDEMLPLDGLIRKFAGELIQ
ncbi:mobA [Symbiodinium natans]|uniref:MobA protein n=1 Tax=Symbiodinium natans TaxID=878477 RepID=A0A812JSP6_9DINO|nr:mobA [Symbiodinium natans]